MIKDNSENKNIDYIKLSKIINIVNQYKPTNILFGNLNKRKIIKKLNDNFECLKETDFENEALNLPETSIYKDFVDLLANLGEPQLLQQLDNPVFLQIIVNEIENYKSSIENKRSSKPETRCTIKVLNDMLFNRNKGSFANLESRVKKFNIPNNVIFTPRERRLLRVKTVRQLQNIQQQPDLLDNEEFIHDMLYNN